LRKEFDLSPTGLTKILAEYGMAIDQIKDYERIQNGSVVEMAKRIDGLDQKMDKKIEELSVQNSEILKKIDALKDSTYAQNLALVQLIHENNEKFRELDNKTDEKRDLNFRQRMTWTITLIIGIPSVLWSCVQLINFLVRRV
jgi:hypothetical protein